MALPVVQTTAASSITTTTASSGGNVTSDGGATITERGIVFATTINPTTANSKIISTGTTGAFVSSLTALGSGVTYHIRAYAINSVGTSYGTDTSFTTLALPVVVSSGVASITTSSATASATVNSDGGATITERGIVYSTSVNPTTANNKLISSGTTGAYNLTITGLTALTSYHFRAYAINSVGTSYGADISFSTISLPVVSTSGITGITSTGANIGGNVSSDGGSVILERGVVYGTSVNPTTSNTKFVATGTTGIFSGTISSLTGGTVYHVRAYATNAAGTVYGGDSTFTTPALPTVTTTAVTTITATSAASGGNVTSDGGSSITSRGIVYSTNVNPTTADTKIIATGTTGTFTSSITGLISGVTYHIRSFATNSVGTNYGTDISFTTLSVPVLTTTAVSAISTTGATSGGNVTSDGGATITERGIVYSLNANPTVTDTKLIATGTTGAFTSTLTGLNNFTTYHIRAYAINSLGTSYGADISFTTLSSILVPSAVTAINTNSITAFSAGSGGYILNDGGAAITERGTVYSVNAIPTIADAKATVSGTTGSFSTSLTGLLPGTTYHYRAYATNIAGTGYGNEYTFTTLPLATVTTGAATLINATNATIGGNVSSDGGVAITERGVVFATTANPTVANTKFTVTGTTGVFSGIITGLVSGTTYHIRAFATNANGTAYGADLTFTTTGLPAVLSTSVSAFGPTTATCGGNVVTDSGLVISERGIVYSTSANPTLLNNKLIVTGTTGVFSGNLTGLTASTVYHYRAYAINGNGIGYGADIVFNTAGIPLVSTLSTSAIGNSVATVAGNVISDSGSVITERGVVYGTSLNPTTAGNKVSTTGTTGNYSVALTGLTANTVYHIRAYAVNAVGTSYGADSTFTTTAPPPAMATTLSFLAAAANSVNGVNYLNFKTNNAPVTYFQIDRSNDNSYFYGVGRVTSRNAIDSAIYNYAFTDAAPSNNLHFYRITAMLNGVNVGQAPIVSVYNSSLITQGISVAPNPVVTTTTVKLTSGGDNFLNKGILVKSSTGTIMLQQYINQNVTSVSVNFSSFPRGTYYLSVIDQTASVVYYQSTIVK